MHSASPVGRYHYENDGPGYVVQRPRRYYRPYYRPYRRSVVIVQPAPVYASGVVYDTPVVESQPELVPAPAPAPMHLELFGSAQPMLNGAMVGLSMKVEGRSAGVDMRYDHLSLLADDGSDAVDTLHLASAALTWSLLNGEHGRLRVHVGAYAAFAPDVAFVAPGGGFSTSLNLFGPFTAEADAQLALLPFTELDTRAGLGLRLGIVEGRAGMRLVYLNDQGRVDGIAHADAVVGPYVSVGLVL